LTWIAMWAEKKILREIFNSFFFHSQSIPGGHKIFGMAGSTVDLPPLTQSAAYPLLSAVFGALTTCACHARYLISVQTAPQGFPHAELFGALQRHSELRFEPAWSSVGVLCMQLIHASRPHFYPHCTRVWRAVRCPKNATTTNCYAHARDSRFGPSPNHPWPTYYSTFGILLLLCRAAPCAGCTKNLVDVQPRHHFPKILKISNPFAGLTTIPVV
jgi:hypothetical protein